MSVGPAQVLLQRQVRPVRVVQVRRLRRQRQQVRLRARLRKEVGDLFLIRINKSLDTTYSDLIEDKTPDPNPMKGSQACKYKLAFTSVHLQACIYKRAFTSMLLYVFLRGTHFYSSSHIHNLLMLHEK